MRPTVVFVLCPGHSGSTLLGHFLGAHPCILHVGEIVAPMRRGRPFRCRVCEAATCPVWGSALREPFVRECLAQYRGDRWLPGPLSGIVRGMTGMPDLRLALHRRLLESLPATDVVVDSSKTLGWTAWNAGRETAERVAVLQLRRDLRGVLSSHLRRLDPDPLDEVCRSLVRSSERILAFVAKLRSEDVCSVSYEDLVERPAETGALLCRFLGLDFAEQMLDFYRTSQHVIGGNPGPTHQVRAYHGSSDVSLEFLDQTSAENQEFYRNQAAGILPDLRWRQELSDEALDRFERIAGDMNRRLGYDGSA